MSEKAIHDAFKHWIIERANQKEEGNHPYYERVYSGDNEPVDVRSGRKHFHYQPDIVLIRRGGKDVIEIALSESLRTIIGDLALATACGARTALLIVNEEGIKMKLNTMREKLGFLKFYCIELGANDVKDLEKAKQVVGKWITEQEWA